MIFLYPLGLLGLIGVPILIIIYILKSKYTEQTVSSTYLWTLSEKFLKRKNPISKITGIISLILQILAVIAISLAIAHPVFKLSGLANEYCFILDGSGSMNMVEDDKTRFELGKEEIASLIEESAEGSVSSLIYVGDTTRVVYEKTTDKEQALILLNETQPTCTEIDYTNAVGVAQSYFNENPSVLTYLVTDTNYVSNNNVTLLNVASSVKNFAVEEVSYSFSQGTMTVNGKIKAYEASEPLSVELYVDDMKTPKTTGTFVAANYKSTPFVLTYDTTGFSALKVRIANADSLPEDNEWIIFNTKSESTYKTLLVSDTPFFWQTAIGAVSNAHIDVVATEDYEDTKGYGLYVFDNFTPKTMPKDGTVWFVNPEANVENSGFSVQDADVVLDKPSTLEISDSSASMVQKLTGNLIGDDIYISEYVKCGLYRQFTPLYTYKGNPIIFAGSNSSGNREVVFAFNLHDSNLPVLMDFVILTQNLLEYSFPEFLEQSFYYSGDELEVNVISNCDSIKLQSPSGEISYLDTSGAVAKQKLNEVGVYTLTLTVAGTPREFSIYAAMPESERAPVAAAEDLSLQGDAVQGGFDGIYDNLLIFFIILVLLIAADWVVYCYEKYQLR